VNPSQFKIGNKLSIEEDACAQACSDGDHDYKAFFAPSGSVSHFCRSGSISIIDDCKGKAGAVAEQLIHLHAQPAFMDVAPRYGFAMVNYRRETTANRSLPIKVLDHFLYGFRYLVGLGGLGGDDSVSVCQQFAGFNIHPCTFYTRSANINSQYLHKIQSLFQIFINKDRALYSFTLKPFAK